jgi:hypothetical protein
MYAHWLVICLWHRPSVTRESGISLLLDSHLANIQQFLLKVRQRDSREIPFAQEIPAKFHSLGTWTRLQTCQESCHVFGAQLNGIIQTQSQSGNSAC